MKSRKIKLIALFAAILFSTTAFSENEGSMPVYLYYNNTPRIDGIRRPHRAPRNTYLSLEVSYDIIKSQLVFADCQGQVYCYAVTDEDNNIISEGYLNFENQECIYVYLDNLIEGVYVLTVFNGGNEFSGSFEIEQFIISRIQVRISVLSNNTLSV